MSSRREIIAGALLVGYLVLDLMGIAGRTSSATYYEPLFSNLSPINKNLIATILSFMTLASIMIFIYWAQHNNPLFKYLNQHFTLRITIPGYLILGLVPMLYGVILILALGFELWGGWLGLSSFPLILILLTMLLRPKERES